MGMVFIYGSLKRGHFNNIKWNFDDKTRFIREGVLKGYRMFDLGSFPCIVPTGDADDVIHGEIFEYLDPSFEKEISAFEEGYGYKEIEVRVEDMTMRTFVFEHAPENGVLVASGIWEQR